MTQTAASEFPIMRGHARMAHGMDSHFEVPLFSNITRGLWTGCSPAEFPDEHEQVDYNPDRAVFVRYKTPVECHWLTKEIETVEVRQDGDVFLPGRPIKDLRARFSVILNLYPWGRYKVPDGVVYREEQLYDSEDVSGKIDELALWVLDMCPDLGNNVLIHCQAGLNRSNLIAARVLMLGKGLTADQAIRVIRAQRSPLALCNRHFENWLRDFDGE